MEAPLLYVIHINILDAKQHEPARVFFSPSVQGLCLDDGLHGQLGSFWEPAHPRLSMPEWLEVVGGQLPQGGP